MSPSSSDASSSRAPRAASPWSHVVRGESEAVPAAPSSPPSAAAPIVNSEASDRDMDGPSDSSDNNGNEKKSAWSSRAPNGVIEVGPVMGAVSWPALGESAKAASKVSPSDSIKSGSDGSSSSLSPPLVPDVANHHQMKLNSNNPNPNSNRQKPTKRGGGSNSNHGLQVNGGPISPQRPPASVEMPQQILPENLAGQQQEPSPRDMHNHRNNSNWDHVSSPRSSGFSPHSHGGSDHHHRPFHRRGNNGGGGPHNVGRRDPERGGYSNHSNDWNNPPPRHIPPPPPRMHHPRPQFIRTPPPPPPAGGVPYIGPPPSVRPFMAPPIGFPDIPSPVFYVQAPPHAFVAAHPVAHAMPPAMLLNAAEYQRATVLKQIEYYFSNDNLCKDTFLRSRMDEQGWVPVALIAGFNRVRQLTSNIPNNINYVLDLVRSSEIVEVQGERLRRRGDWMMWVLHSQPSQHGSTSSGPHSPVVPSIDNVVDRMQSVVLGESASNHTTGRATIPGVVGRSARGDFINQSQVGDSNEYRQGQLSGYSASDR